MRAPSSLLRATLDVERLAPGGAGIAFAEIDGERRAVFVPRSAPGDRLVVEIDPKRRPASGRTLELVARGADRVDPECPHAAKCGGCNWMHLSPDAQRTAHGEFVRDALPQSWRDIVITSHAAPRVLGYRSRARLHVRASGGRAIVGMNEEGSHEPVEVSACVALDPRLDEARADIASLLDGAHGRGDAQIALGATSPAPRRAVLELRWHGKLPPSVYARLEQAATGPLWQGARIWLDDVTKPSTIADPTPWIAGEDGAPLRVAPGGFAQASDEGNALLVRRVAELAFEVARDKPVVELYAGAGNLTVALARVTRSLVAVESSREACEAARANLAARGLHARVAEADAAAHTLGGTTQLLVLDPPRVGAKDVVAKLADKSPPHVLYVSCDPQTLGRDLAMLEARYAPRVVETFEMFPQTSHVETVVLLERVRKQARARSGA